MFWIQIKLIFFWKNLNCIRKFFANAIVLLVSMRTLLEPFPAIQPFDDTGPLMSWAWKTII